MQLKRAAACGAALALTAALAGGPGLLSAQSSPPWPTFHGNNQRTGSITGNGPTAGTAANEWTLTKAVESSPVIDAGGTAYVGDDDGKVYAFSPSSSTAPKWSFTTNGEVTSAPALSPDGSVVYVASSDGVVYALKASDGSKIWASATGGQITGSPLVSSDGGTVYIGLGPGGVRAYKASDGSVIATQPVNGTIEGSLAMSPDGGTIYYATNIGYLYGVGTSGLGSKNANVTAFYLDGTPFGGPTVDSNGYIYNVVNAGTTSYLDSFTPGSGQYRWHFLIPSGLGGVSSPAIYNGVAYFGDANGGVFAVKTSDGTPAWNTFPKTGGAIKSSPAVAGGNGLVYVGSDDGVIYAFHAADGTVAWSKSVSVAVDSSPALSSDGSMWIGDNGGHVYRFKDLALPSVPGSPPPKATSTPTPFPTPGTPQATPTAIASTTAVANLTVALHGPVKVGAKQTIVVSTSPNTTVKIRVNYPNGDHQSKSVKTNASGKATYTYVQAASKITHNKVYAHVVVKLASGASISHSYKILFGAIDVSAEPRTQAVGGTESVWVHTKAHVRVYAFLEFPDGKFSRLQAGTNSKGWAHMRYKVRGGLTTGKNHKVTVLAKLASGRPNISTKTTFTIR